MIGTDCSCTNVTSCQLILVATTWWSTTFVTVLITTLSTHAPWHSGASIHILTCAPQLRIFVLHEIQINQCDMTQSYMIDNIHPMSHHVTRRSVSKGDGPLTRPVHLYLHHTVIHIPTLQPYGRLLHTRNIHTNIHRCTQTCHVNLDVHYRFPGAFDAAKWLSTDSMQLKLSRQNSRYR